MLNIKPLTRFPLEVHEIFLNFYYTWYSEVAPKMAWSNAHFATELLPKEQEFLSGYLPMKAGGVEIYYIQPNSTTSAHIDRGRKTALQIPIDVPLDSYTFCSKTRNIDDHSAFTHMKFDPRKEKFGIINNPGKWFFRWEPEKFDTHSMDVPVLSSVEHPHGGTNNSDVVRIFISVSYHIGIDEVAEYYKDWM